MDRAGGPTEAHAASVADWGGRPRYAPTDFITLLWGERWLMIGVGAVIFALGLAVAFTLPTKYTAHSSLLVRLGQEYVYQPRTGNAAEGVAGVRMASIPSEKAVSKSRLIRVRTFWARR